MLGIVGTLLGTIFGGVIGYIVSAAQAQQLARASASLALRDAFKAELLALDASLSVKSDVPNLLQSAFEKHRSAVFDFCWYLTEEEKPIFLKAWETYYTHKDLVGQNGIPFFEQYSTRGRNTSESRGIKNLAACRINDILFFARPKPLSLWSLCSKYLTSVQQHNA